MKAFNKGDLVTIIINWDRKGTVVYRHGVVHSCGKKQMIIFDPIKGDEIGRNFRPVRATDNEIGVHAAMDDAAAMAVCLKAGAQVVIDERARFEHRLTIGEGENYNNAIRKQMVELHEPRAMSYEEACEIIRKRVG